MRRDIAYMVVLIDIKKDGSLKFIRSIYKYKKIVIMKLRLILI